MKEIKILIDIFSIFLILLILLAYAYFVYIINGIDNIKNEGYKIGNNIFKKIYKKAFFRKNPDIKKILLILETDEKYKDFRKWRDNYYRVSSLLSIISEDTTGRDYYNSTKKDKKYYFINFIEKTNQIAQDFKIPTKILIRGINLSFNIEELK